MITDQRADDALEWLTLNTRQMGAARGRLERSEILRKRARKRAFIEASDGSVAFKEAQAELHTDVLSADRSYVRAVIRFESMKAKQQIETITLDVWRTEAANRRRG